LGQRAEIGLVREARHGGGQIRAQNSIHEDQPGRIEQRQPGEDRFSLMPRRVSAELCIRQGTQAGVFPGFRAAPLFAWNPLLPERRRGIGAQATQDGAFGDTGTALQQSLNDKNTQQQIGNATGQAYDAAYQSAVGQKQNVLQTLLSGANDAAVAEIVFRWSWNMMQRAYDYAKNETIKRLI
jgi:hypothetical protein